MLCCEDAPLPRTSGFPRFRGGRLCLRRNDEGGRRDGGGGDWGECFGWRSVTRGCRAEGLGLGRVVG